ncbi:MAG: glycosyltransferase [candidate division SR1 bacterium]|nr:glycosyltransferase [candidate division SR1 bacterium]
MLSLIGFCYSAKTILPVQLFVFGSGTYEKEIMQLAHKYKAIHFFGRQARETIRRYVSNCNFILAPTTCLETFGLVALSGLERGIPTIGFAKGGATPFIDPSLDLTNVEGETLPEKLYHLITRLGKEDFFTNSLPVAEILEHHSIENWKANIAYLLGNKKKILIVSDFTNKIGGLETYINDAKDIVHNMGYEAELFGTKIRTGALGKLMKYFGFIAAIANIRASIQLRIKVKKMKPDLIRYNSVMRYIGRLPLRTMKKAKAEKRMMYHDLGYFYPFPSKLEREEQIKTPLTFSKFLSSVKTQNPIIKLAIIGKYILLKLIQRQLKKSMDLHIVPSAFMRPILQKSYRIDDEKITVLSHFIQE